MHTILLIFAVSFNLVSSDVVNVQQLLARVDMLERKLATLSNEMLLEDRQGQSLCNCSDLEEDIRNIGIIAAKNRHNIFLNNEMIHRNEDTIGDNFELNSGLIQTNIDMIAENAKANENSLNVRIFLC